MDKLIFTDIEKELKFSTSRSSGPGGQHVNKVNTKVTLRWKIKSSSSVDEEQQLLIFIKLKKVINNLGEVVISADSNRSQLKNKQDVIQKLAALLEKAFFKQKARKATKPTKASVKRRLQDKKRISTKKKLRRDLD